MPDPQSPPNPTAAVAETKPPGKWSWRNLKGRFLFISIALHVLLALVATYLVVTTIQARKPPNFKAGPPAAAPSRSDSVKVKAVQKQRSMSAPAPTKRITSTAVAKVALPEMPDMPSPASAPPTTMGGIGGTGVSFGGMGAPGGSGGGGGGMTLFGLREAGSGLEGRFYDFKRLARNRPNDKIPPFPEIVKTFALGEIGPKGLKNYQSPTKLYAKTFLFPGIPDTEAGKSFQTPEAGPGRWLVHYKGEFVSPVDGTYRFVGFGDNVMIVKLDAAIVLDASDKDFLGKREAMMGTLNLGAKQGAGIFPGTWFTLTRGQSKKIEIVAGDEGGIFCAGIFLQKKEVPYKTAANGVPDLPLFVIGSLDARQRAALEKFVPPTAFQGPVFSLGKGGTLNR